MPPKSQELTAEEILKKAFNNCQKLHICGKIFAFAQNKLWELNLAKQERVISQEEYSEYNKLFTQFEEKMPEMQVKLKKQNAQLGNDYYTKSNSAKNQSYCLSDKTKISVNDLFNCNISKIPDVTPSDANNSSATNENKSVPANANSPKSTPINSSKSAMNSQKPAVPASKNPVSILKSNVSQKPTSTKNLGKKVTFGINNTQPPVTKKTQVNNNNKNTNTAQNGQASSAAFNKNKELINSVNGKMNKQVNDFQPRSNFKPIVNSQKNMHQTINNLIDEAGALNDDGTILSEVKKIRNIINNMTVIVKMQKEKLEKICETNDTEGLLSRGYDIRKNWDYLQKKYPCLLVHGETAVRNMKMPSDFVSGKSNWEKIKDRYIKLKYLKKDLENVDSAIANKIADYRRETEETVNRNLQDHLKTIIDIYRNRAKTMDNNNMFAVKVLTFIEKLNFTSLGLDNYFNEMASSVIDNHIKKYANNSKVTDNDDYLINFHQKYPKNIHDDSNIDRNTISNMPSNLNSLNLSSRDVSFQKPEKKPTNNVAGNLKPGSASSGNLKSVSKPVAADSTQKNKNKDASATKTPAQQQKKNVAGKSNPATPTSSGNPKNGSKPVADGSTQKNKNKDASAKKPPARKQKNVADKSNPAAPTPSGNPKSVSKPVAADSTQKNKNKNASAKTLADTASSGKSKHKDKSHKKSPTNTSVTVGSDSIWVETPEKDNKALNSSAIDWSISKTSKTLNNLKKGLDYASQAALSKNLSQIEYLKGLAEKIMDKYYEEFNKLYNNKEEKRYVELDMQMNDIHNKYKDFVNIGGTGGYPDLESIKKPYNFKGTEQEWTKFKSAYEKLSKEHGNLHSKLGSKWTELNLRTGDLLNRTKSKLKSEVVSKLEETKSDLDKKKSKKIQDNDQKKIVKSIIEYVGSLIEKYSDISRNISKISSIKNDPTKTMWKYQKRGAGEGFTPELGDVGG